MRAAHSPARDDAGDYSGTSPRTSCHRRLRAGAPGRPLAFFARAVRHSEALKMFENRAVGPAGLGYTRVLAYGGITQIWPNWNLPRRRRMRRRRALRAATMKLPWN